MCGPSMSSSASSTSATRRSLMSLTAPMKPTQKSCSTCCQEISLLETRSSCSSSEAVGVVVFLVVAAFLIEREETVEFHDLAGGAQFQHAGAGFRRDVHGGAFQLRGFHLARDSADPDQLIEPGLVVIELATHFRRT